jgi:LGFP repeat
MAALTAPSVAAPQTGTPQPAGTTGIALASPLSSSGSFAVAGAIYDKWQTLAGQTVAGGGQTVQSYLGYPVAVAAPVPDDRGGGTAQTFQRGMIVAAPNGAAAVVYGQIYLRYVALGGVSSVLGRPVADEANADGGGRVSKFAEGNIYWSGGSGAHEVHGAILERYLALGGPGGVLGYPTCCETEIMIGGKEIGRFNRFLGNGAIYWSGATGAWEVYGPVLTAWEGEAKGVAGPLGLPVAAQIHSPARTETVKGKLEQVAPETETGTFQKGLVLWHASGATPGAHVFSGLDLFVQNLVARGSHTFWEDIGFASDWLYVNLSVIDKTTNRKIFSRRLPACGHWGASAVLNEKFELFSATRPNTAFQVTFDGWDAVAIGNDVHLGTAVSEYNAGNLWGLTQISNAWHNDFLAAYSIESTTPYNAADFRQELWWGFHNFDTASLSWDTFAQTFSDVQESEIHWEHPFDWLFYTLVYEGLAAPGNCFGMAIESVYAQVGRSLFAEPIVNYPASAQVLQEINIKMGYQLGGDFIDWFLGQWVSGTVRDPVNTFSTSLAQFNRGDLPVISVASSEWGADGHCVRPYRWYDGNYPGKPGMLVILVANPNSPAVPYTNDGGGNAVPDNDPSCMIVIDKARNTFTLQAAPGSTLFYTGGKGSGGMCFSIPFSQFSSQPRTPFWEALALLVAGTLILFGGDAKTQQITDSAGRTFYDPTLTQPPQTLDHVRTDANRIPNMARLPKFGAAPTAHPTPAKPTPKKPAPVSAKAVKAQAQVKAVGHVTTLPDVPEVYYLNGGDGDLTHEAVAQGTGSWQWHLRSPGLGVVVTAPCSPGKKDVVKVSGVARNDANVTITPAADGAPKQATVSLSGGSRDGASTFSLSNLALTPGKGVSVAMAGDGKGIQVHSPEAASSFDLAVQTGSAAPKTFKSVALAAGKPASIALGTTAGQIRLQTLDRPGGTVLSETVLS